MQGILVTGNPGSGKTTVAAELQRRGFATIDPDHDRALSHWLDADGNRVDRREGPIAPTGAWLAAHHWVWNRGRMEELLTAADGPVFVCGIATNQVELFDLFAVVFLLCIDEDTQEERLLAHDRAHPPGRSEAGRQQIRDGRPIFEAEMRAEEVVPIDGSLPTPEVADAILRHLES